MLIVEDDEHEGECDAGHGDDARWCGVDVDHAWSPCETRCQVMPRYGFKGDDGSHLVTQTDFKNNFKWIFNGIIIASTCTQLVNRAG